MKIFGVGLGKTGTTSLHYALEALGFRSIHSIPHVYNALVEDCRSGRPLLSSLADDFDAFLEYPIWALYKRLDRLYPESKFILTVRDPEDLYASTLRHAREHNKLVREGMEASPLWYVLRSRGRFAAHCRAHVSSVTRHFSGREGQLLVLNIFDRHVDAWTALGGFLRRPAPRVEFPHANVGGRFVQSGLVRMAAPAPAAWREKVLLLRRMEVGLLVRRAALRLLSWAP